jgi:hypothetical protein
MARQLHCTRTQEVDTMPRKPVHKTAKRPRSASRRQQRKVWPAADPGWLGALAGACFLLGSAILCWEEGALEAIGSADERGETGYRK